MSKIINRVIDRIGKNRIHGFPCLDNGFNRLNEYIYGVQQSTNYLLGGNSGSGKTALCDQMFLNNPYKFIKSEANVKNYKLKILYFSMEIPAENKILKFVAKKMYDDWGLYLDVNYLLSKGKHRVSDEIFKKVVETRDYFEELESIIDIKEYGVNPTQVYYDIRNYARKNGKFFGKEDEELSIDFNLKGEALTKEMQKVSYYKPNDPNEFVIIIGDHNGLWKGEEGAVTKKERIDKTSGYFKDARNAYGYSGVLVSQFNRSLQGMDRRGGNSVEPQESDFKETSNPYEDANVVLTTFTPSMFNLATYKDYNINLLGDRFKGLTLLKNRDGEANKTIGCYFLGKIGEYREMPLPKEMTEQGLYEKYNERFRKLNEQENGKW